jgi:hypothetical protein
MGKLAYIFFLFAVLFAIGAYTTTPTTSRYSKTITTQRNTLQSGMESLHTSESGTNSSPDQGFTALAFGIISAACFCCSAFLISKQYKQ